MNKRFDMTNYLKIPLIDQTNSFSETTKKWLLITWGIIALSASVYFLYQTMVLGTQFNGGAVFNLVILPMALFVIGASLKSSFIQIDNQKIQYKLNYFKPTKTIQVNQISEIKIDFTDVKIILENGETHTIDFGAAKHSNIGKIKSKLKDIQG